MLPRFFASLLALTFSLAALSACAIGEIPAPASTKTSIPEPVEETAAEEVTEPAEKGGDEEPAQEATKTDETAEETTTDQTQDRPALACDDTLEPTESNPAGPFYKRGAPERSVLVEPGMAGTRLVLTGQVLTTDCQPVAGALLDFWQADDQGEYDNVGFTLRGTQFTDEMGHYRLETIVPARYPGRPPHIHVKVNAPDGPVLTTQLYFEGQPGNESDALVRPALTVPLADTAGDSKAATFNFVLASE
jgi:protocatechuate 3,4-dioxygenase beta subunit